MDNFKVIYQILKYLEASMDYTYFDSKAISAEALRVSRERWEQLLILMQEEGYIKGLVYIQYLGQDRAVLLEPIKPRITIKGLEYLSENGIMKRPRMY